MPLPNQEFSDILNVTQYMCLLRKKKKGICFFFFYFGGICFITMQLRGIRCLSVMQGAQKLRFLRGETIPWEKTSYDLIKLVYN
jgi:hypothetical protein